MSQPMPRPEERRRDRSELAEPPAYRSEGFFEDLACDEVAAPVRRLQVRGAQPWALLPAAVTLSLRPAA